MGRDKAFLEVDGLPLLARQITVARETGAREVFISGRADTDYTAFGRPVLRDRFPNAGPLAGIEHALEVMTTPLLLVLAVDLPGLGVEFLRSLLARCEASAGVIPRVLDRVEPLVAVYPGAARPLAVTMLQEGNRIMTSFAQRCVHSGLASEIELPPGDSRHFVNWNTPADISAAGCGAAPGSSGGVPPPDGSGQVKAAPRQNLPPLQYSPGCPAV